MLPLNKKRSLDLYKRIYNITYQVCNNSGNQQIPLDELFSVNMTSQYKEYRLAVILFETIKQLTGRSGINICRVLMPNKSNEAVKNKANSFKKYYTMWRGQLQTDVAEVCTKLRELNDIENILDRPPGEAGA